MEQESIMDAYYETVTYKLNKKKEWVTKFFPDRARGTRPLFDFIDAATGEVVAEAGKKVTPRAVKKLKDEGKVTELALPYDELLAVLWPEI